MATFTQDITLKFQSTTDSDIEEVDFSSGDEVELVESWPDVGQVLIKDDDDHYFNVDAAVIEE